MALSLYVMPLIGTGAENDYRRPKYQVSIFAALNWAMFDYGNEPRCLVAIVDIPTVTDAALKANPDVIALPANLDQQIGTGSLAKVRSDLELVNIPGTWVQATNTWRYVVRFVGAVCQFAQRFQGQTGGLWFAGGVTLASTYGSLPLTVRQGLLSAATSFGFDTTGLVSTSTLRQILLSVGNQYLATQPALRLAGLNL